jgi:ComF family protein
MLRRLINGVTDLFYPKICLSCKAKLDNSAFDTQLCPICKAGIKANIPPFCSICGRHLQAEVAQQNICPGCLENKLCFDHAFSPCIYEGVIKKLIHEFKYCGKKHLSATLSKLMIDFINEYRITINELDFIIPMPLHNARLREREFNQAQILSERIAGVFNKEVILNTLIRSRPTKTQTDLPLNKRFENVAGSFEVNKIVDLKDKDVLLIDDVLTTGASCSEAAMTLKKTAGVNRVIVLTLAS